MRKISNLFKGINILTIISTSVAIASLYIAFINKWPLELFPKTANFSCELIPNSDKDEVWTVMYRKDKQNNPWLKIEATFGSNWTPAERCQAIAQRLEIYRQDGLTQLTYRSDPSTPKQYVICAKTKVGGDNCHLLVTLKPNIDPYESLRYMTETLTGETSLKEDPGLSFSNSNNNKNRQIVINLDPDTAPTTAPKVDPPFLPIYLPLVIDLEKHLSDEDRKAGDATQ